MPPCTHPTFFIFSYFFFFFSIIWRRFSLGNCPIQQLFVSLEDAFGVKLEKIASYIWEILDNRALKILQGNENAEERAGEGRRGSQPSLSCTTVGGMILHVHPKVDTLLLLRWNVSKLWISCTDGLSSLGTDCFQCDPQLIYEISSFWRPIFLLAHPCRVRH